MFEAERILAETRSGVASDGVDMSIWNAIEFDDSAETGLDSSEGAVFIPSRYEQPDQFDQLYGEGFANRTVAIRRNPNATLGERLKGEAVVTNEFAIVSKGIASVYRDRGADALRHGGEKMAHELLDERTAGRLNVSLKYVYDTEFPDHQNLVLKINIVDQSKGAQGINPAIVLDLGKIGNYKVRQSIMGVIQEYENAMIAMGEADPLDPTVAGEGRGFIFGALSFPDSAEYPYPNFISPDAKLERTNAFYSLFITAFDRMALEYKKWVAEVDPQNAILRVPYRLLRNKMALGFFELAQASWMPNFDQHAIVNEVEQRRKANLSDEDAQSLVPANAAQRVEYMPVFTQPEPQERQVEYIEESAGVAYWPNFFEIARERVRTDTQQILEEVLDINALRDVILEMQFGDDLEREIYEWANHLHKIQSGNRALPVEHRADLNRASQFNFDVTEPIVRLALMRIAMKPMDPNIEPWLDDFNAVVDAMGRFDNALFTNDKNAFSFRANPQRPRWFDTPASRMGKKKIFFTRLDEYLFTARKGDSEELQFPTLAAISRKGNITAVLEKVFTKLSAYKDLTDTEDNQ